jgi:lipopolysaccharide transport system permease protein
MVVFTIVFSKFAKIQSDGIAYPIFSYCALLPWAFFSGALTSAISSIVDNSNLIKQIYFPREIFPLSSIAANFFDFCVASIIFIGMAIFYKINVTVFIVLVPVLLSLQILFTIGLSFFLSALNVYYRDISHAAGFIIQIGMFACPIVYPASAVPENLRSLYMLNPMAVIIDGYRRVILLGAAPEWKDLLVATLTTLIVCGLSYQYFKRSEHTFADIV